MKQPVIDVPYDMQMLGSQISVHQVLNGHSIRFANSAAVKVDAARCARLARNLEACVGAIDRRFGQSL
jgi:hypothetical protein